MKEINLASAITAKRREKGVTQSELAAYIGVSKASVSKWETGQSYPDIMLLPVLAAYFDISIDQLMGYTPQMEKGDIQRLYERLAADFAERPFEEVVAECEETVRKYYSCYPLLLQIALLYINHASRASEEERARQVMASAIRLCERVEENSKDTDVTRQAIIYQALCCLSLGDGEAVLELLGESPRYDMQGGILIAQAFQLLGKAEKAQEVIQIDLYQGLMALFQSLLGMLQSSLDHFEAAEAVYRRAEGLAALFDMDRLNPNNMAMLYALGAQMYQVGGFPEKAIALLSQYVDVCIHGFFPVVLRGDGFFDRIDGWLAENTAVVPRSEAVIKESMMADVLQNPVFQPLQAYPEYGKVIQKLKAYIGRN